MPSLERRYTKSLLTVELLEAFDETSKLVHEFDISVFDPTPEERRDYNSQVTFLDALELEILDRELDSLEYETYGYTVS